MVRLDVMGARLWYKVHHNVWTAPSLREAGFYAKGFFVFLMSLADHDEDWKSNGWALILNGDCSPMSIATIAKIAEIRRDVAQGYMDKLTSADVVRTGYLHASYSEDTVKTQPRDTQEAGLAQVYWIPKYRKWQESQKTTNARAAKEGGKKATYRGEQRRTEEKENNVAVAPPQPKLDLYGDAARRVLTRLNERRQEVVPGARAFSPTKSNLKEIHARLVEGEAEELLLAVVDAAAREADGKPEQHRWLNPTTPFRASNLARYVALADVGNAAATITDSDEANAYAREHKRPPLGWVWHWDGETVVPK